MEKSTEEIELLTKDMLDEFKRESPTRDFDPSNPDELILVHKTRVCPQNSMIYTASDSPNPHYLKKYFYVNGNKNDILYKQERTVINFAVNHEVVSHMEGNWDDCEYIVLIPWKSVDDKIVGGDAADIYAKGSVNINGGYLLVPKGEKEQAIKANPGMQVIEYEGENALGYGNLLIHKLGYSYQKSNVHNWINEENADAFFEYLKKEGKQTIRDADAEHRDFEFEMNHKNIYVSIFKHLYKNFDTIFKEKADVLNANIIITTNGINRQESALSLVEELQNSGIQIPNDIKEFIGNLYTGLDTRASEVPEKDIMDFEKIDWDNLSYPIRVLFNNNFDKLKKWENESYDFYDVERFKMDILQRIILSCIAKTKGMMNENEDILLNESELIQLKDYIKCDYVREKITSEQLEQYADKYNIKPEEVELIKQEKKKNEELFRLTTQQEESKKSNLDPSAPLAPPPIITAPPAPAPPPYFLKLAEETGINESDITGAMKSVQKLVEDPNKDINQNTGR